MKTTQRRYKQQTQNKAIKDIGKLYQNKINERKRKWDTIFEELSQLTQWL
jgi:hypothetical protein